MRALEFRHPPTPPTALSIRPPDAAASAIAAIRDLRAQRRLSAAPALLARVAAAPGPLAIEAFNLGIDLLRAGLAAESKAAFAFALRCEPGFAEAHLELAARLLGEQRFLDAIAPFGEAARLKPSLSGAWLGLGQCLLRTGQGTDALRAFAQVRGEFAQSPTMTAWRGIATAQAGDDDGALALYVDALAREPGNYDACFGKALIDDRRFALDQAAQGYARANAAQPGDNRSLGNLVYTLRRMCAWHEMAAPEHELLARLERGEIGSYATQWIGLDLSAEAMRRIAATFIRAQSSLHVRPSAPASAVAHADGRLRIGYVSADFRDHATARLLVETLEQHDRSRLACHAYALAPRDDSPLGRRIVAACEHFVDASGWSAAQLAARLREDGIDVMVDLHGHTRGSLHGLLALKPAPIVVNYLGFPGTMGDYADYIVGDRYVTPPGSEAEFSEAIVRLPGSYQPNDRRRETGPPSTRTEHGLAPDAIVACSFNQSWKFGPLLWGVWMDAMRRHARLVLWLPDDNRWATANLRRAAAQAGVDAARIVFAPRLPQAAHLSRLALADLALDTAPCTSHTTASDALWMGVPLLTLRGRSFDARVAASLLHAVELPELVTSSADEYAARLDALLAEPARLAALRETLLGGRASARLWDARAHARALERAYAAMVDRQRAGLAPAPIEIEE